MEETFLVPMGLLIVTVAVSLGLLVLEARHLSNLGRLKRQVILSWNRVDTLIARRNAYLRRLLAEYGTDPLSDTPLQDALAREDIARRRGDLEALGQAESILRQYVPGRTDRFRGHSRLYRRMAATHAAIDEALTLYNQSVESCNRAKSRGFLG